MNKQTDAKFYEQQLKEIKKSRFGYYLMLPLSAAGTLYSGISTILALSEGNPKKALAMGAATMFFGFGHYALTQGFEVNKENLNNVRSELEELSSNAN